MAEGYKIYLTDWIFGIGRGVVITTTQQRVDHLLVAEAFTFVLDPAPDEKYFCPRLVTHTPLGNDVPENGIDLGFLELEAQKQGIAALERLRLKKYEDCGKRELLRERITLHPSHDRHVLISLKYNGDYVSELERVRDITACTTLKEYLRFILGIKMEIRDI